MFSVLYPDAAYNKQQTNRGGIINGFVQNKVYKYEGKKGRKVHQVTDPVGGLCHLQGFKPEEKCNSHLVKPYVNRCS